MNKTSNAFVNPFLLKAGRAGDVNDWWVFGEILEITLFQTFRILFLIGSILQYAQLKKLESISFRFFEPCLILFLVQKFSAFVFKR